MYFLNINKPKGITSFDVIKYLRKRLNIKAIGHSGTLDPLASGVMQIGVGKATKLLDYLDSDKTYIADIKFGYNSSTMDEEGEKFFVSKPEFRKDELLNVIKSFIGITTQIPPKYSAIKQDGIKLCDYIRHNPNAEIKIKPRLIEIYSINLLNFDNDIAKIEVHCKKGTYIRSLAQDIGTKLGCGAYILNLIRTKAGSFTLDKADDIDSSEYKKINPIDVLNLDSYSLNDTEYDKIVKGQAIITQKNFFSNNIILTKNNKLVSIAILSDNYNNGSMCVINPKRNFNEV